MSGWLTWALVGGLAGLGALWLTARHAATTPRRRLARISARRDSRRRRSAVAILVRRPDVIAVAACAVTTMLAIAAGGPVAGAVVLAYSVIAAAEWRGRIARRATERRRAETLDSIGALAAELRAGLPPAELSIPDPVSSPGSEARSTARSVARSVAIRRPDPVVVTACARVGAAFDLSESLGAPLADLLDRVDADLRAGHRLRAGVAAQTAGAQATALLLAGLPVMGIVLGTGMGADPLGRLLHTPVGAVCALSAVALQCAGLIWATRLTHAAVEAVA